MAFAFSFIIPNITPLVSIKLDATNYLNQTIQFLRVLHSHDLLSIVDGSESCPPQYKVDAIGIDTFVLSLAYLLWHKKDQFILAWLNAPLIKKVMSTIYDLTTSHQVWNVLSNRFAPHSQSQISHLKRQLQTLYQGNKSCFDYLITAKSWSDQFTAVGKPVEDDNLISFIVDGLQSFYHPFVIPQLFYTRCFYRF